MMRVAFTMLLMLGAMGAVARADLQNREVDFKAHPVSKIITLLKDMLTQLDKEGEEDAETYEKMGCWCETNDKEKTKAISDGEARIKALGASIEEFTSGSAKLTAEIGSLEEEITKDEEALGSAKALRTKQLAEFNAEEKDALGSIGSLKSAVVALSKHHEAAFLQTGHEGPNHVMSVVRKMFRQHRFMLQEVISPHQRRLLEGGASLLQEPHGYSLAQQAPSGEIFGVLKQMKETFETNLASSQQEETANQKAFEDLKAAKEDELSAGKSQLSTKQQELAVTDEKNAQSKEDLEDTQDTLEADTKFLADVKAKCANMDADFAERTKTRQGEIAATNKALSFLTSDEAHELFGKSLGFTQVSASAAGARRVKVAQTLQKVAKKSRDPRLATIAVQLRLDSFGKVKETLQSMADKLVKEKEEEIAKKDFCVDAFNKNQASTEKETRTQTKEDAKVEDYTQSVADLGKAIEQLKAEIAEANKQMKRAGEDRELANKDFQEVMADQRATQKLLNGALNALKSFYGFVQTNSARGSAKQPAFKTYEKNANSGGVMGMIQGVINDSKSAEAEAMTAEEDSQTAYEIFVKDTNEMVTEKTKDIINKSEMKGKAEADLVEHTKMRDDAVGTLAQLASELHDTHIECDYLLKNYELRTTARDEEIEALKQAIATFSGASFSAFLQSR